MQSESFNTALTQYALPAAKVAAGVALIKYLASLDAKSDLVRNLLGRADIDYKSETTSSTTGRKQEFNLSIHCNLFPIIAGLYLIKSGIQNFRK
jgi:hypothetical protein